MANPYEALGVSKTATQDEIRAAYRRLAKQYHPDLQPGDKKAEERFKQVTSANELLSDPDKRHRYDAGEIDEHGQEKPRTRFYRDFARASGGEKYDRGAFDEDLGGLGGVFSDLFGRRSGGEAGGFADAVLSIALRIPFMAAARGGRQTVSLPDGRRIDVEIPEGAEDRQMIRAKLAAGGDVLIELHVEPHAFFERRDSNVHLELPVTVTEAVLGGRVEVPTVRGPVMLSIPPDSNTGSTLRLKDRGIRDRRSGAYGDQYVKLRVVLPETADAKLREFLASWDAGKAYDPRRHMKVTS